MVTSKFLSARSSWACVTQCAASMVCATPQLLIAISMENRVIGRLSSEHSAMLGDTTVKTQTCKAEKRTCMVVESQRTKVRH